MGSCFQGGFVLSLGGSVVNMPPLREHKGDIPIWRFFLKQNLTLSPAALGLLLTGVQAMSAAASCPQPGRSMSPWKCYLPRLPEEQVGKTSFNNMGFSPSGRCKLPAGCG